MNKKIFLVALPIILLASIVVGWFYIKSTPQYSLFQMYKAVQNHDYNTFTKYADVDSIANNLIDKVLADAKVEQDKKTQGNVWEQMGASFAQGLIVAMKPGLVEQVKTTVKKGVEEGDLKGANYKPNNIIATLTSIKVKQEGKVADVTITLDDNKPFTLKMRQMEGYWQVFNMDLAASSFQPDTKPNDSSQISKQAKYGENVDIGLGWFLSIASPSAYTNYSAYSGPKDGEKYIVIEATYENTTDKPGTFFVDNIKVRDIDNHQYPYTYSGKSPALTSGTLEGGGKVKGYLTYEIPITEQIKSVVYVNSYNGNTVIFGE